MELGEPLQRSSTGGESLEWVLCKTFGPYVRSSPVCGRIGWERINVYSSRRALVERLVGQVSRVSQTHEHVAKRELLHNVVEVRWMSMQFDLRVYISLSAAPHPEFTQTLQGKLRTCEEVT